MGWYTTNGESTFQWKYGNVIALARESKPGELRLMPRVTALRPDGEILDGEEFLGRLQHWALKKKLPWERPIPFDPRDKDHETLLVPNDIDVDALLRKWVAVLRANREPLVAALRHYNDVDDDDDDGAVVELSLGTEAWWSLPKGRYGALVAWLNQPFSGRAEEIGFQLDALRAGTIEDDEYEPSAETQAALDALPESDGLRCMAACALGHALVEKSKLELFQPSDEYDEQVWKDADAS